MTSTDTPLAVSELLAAEHQQLWQRATALGLTPTPGLSHDGLAALLVQHSLDRGDGAIGEGVLSVLPEGYGFLRQWRYHLAPSAVDAFVGPGQIRALQLRHGQQLRGALRGPREHERSLALIEVDPHSLPPADTAPFASRVASVPSRPLTPCGDSPLGRELGELAPWRRGERVMVRGPTGFAAAPWFARCGAWLQDAAPELAVLLCLLDARPEQVAAVRNALGERRVQVAAVEFGADPAQQLATAELVEQAAQRLAEQGRDVVVALDSLDALAHAHQRSRPASGVWAQPGIDARALQVTRRWLAAARQLQGAGSVTVLAHATGSGVTGAALLAELAPFANSDVVLVDDGHDGVRLDRAAMRARGEAPPQQH